MAGFGILNQLGEASLASFFLLGADDAIGGGSAIPGRLRLEVLPGFLVGAELSLVGGTELGVLALLVGVDSGLIALARLEGLDSRRMHEAEPGHFLRAPDVNRAPGAGWLAGREADAVADLVDGVADAVDPAIAEGHVHRLGPGDAGLTRSSLVEADGEFLAGRMVLFQPGAELGRACEEECLSGGRFQGASILL